MILTSRRRHFYLVGQSKHKVGACGVNNQASAVLAVPSATNWSQCSLYPASNHRAASKLSVMPKNSENFPPSRSTIATPPGFHLVQPIAVMPLSRKENTTLAKPRIKDLS
ncbi:hypothetical protein TNCV_4752291 [Trichonephila clavipes]|nr:hypothetical protein TNCV_4752291 [Trichonephila clavipes]